MTYYLNNGDKKIVYSSIKEAERRLPPHDFMRLHRSYIINRHRIDSYNKDNVIIASYELPRGKDIVDSQLQNSNVQLSG